MNFINLFPHARIERHPQKNAYHLFADGVTSSLHLRMMFNECAGRIYMSQKRLELIGEPGDIIFEWKGVFEYVETKNGLLKRWIKKPTSYEPCSLRDVLVLPFCSQIDFHQRRRIRWYKKRYLPRLKEMKKEAHRNGRTGF